MSIRVKNTSGQTIPPYAIMLMTSPVRLANNVIVMQVEQPSLPPRNAGRQKYLINGATSIGINGSGRYGHGTPPTEAPQWIAYTGTAPSTYGEMWGIANNSWYLTKDKAGFEISGLANTDKSIVLATFVPQPMGYFVLTAALSKPSSISGTPSTAAATLYKVDTINANQLKTGQSITVTSRWKDLSLASGKGGYCHWDWSLGEWVITATECPT